MFKFRYTTQYVTKRYYYCFTYMKMEADLSPSQENISQAAAYVMFVFSFSCELCLCDMTRAIHLLYMQELLA